MKIGQSEEISIIRSSGIEEKIKTQEIRNNVYNNYTSICDYTDNCELKCSAELPLETEVHMGTYNIDFAKNNMDGIIKRIRVEFKNAPNGLFYFHHDDLFNIVNVKGNYTEEQFDMTIAMMVENGGEILVDSYGRKGRLINKKKWYYFQPLEITDINASIFERSVPVENKQYSFPASNIMSTSKNETNNKVKQRDTEEREGMDKKGEYNNLIHNINFAFGAKCNGNKVIKVTYNDNIETYNKFNWNHNFVLLKPHIENIIKSDETLKQIIVDHFIDNMRYDNTKKLMEGFFNIYPTMSETDISDINDKKILNYFNKRKIGEHYHIIRTKEKKKEPSFFKWNIEDKELLEESDRTSIIQLIKDFKSNYVEPKSLFGFIDSEIKFNSEEKIFKIRNKMVAKNKKGSIIRGTYEKNKDIIIKINSDAKIDVYAIKEDIKEPYITAALPMYVELLLRNKNKYEKGNFLSIDEFYLFSNSEK